jgi:hypothetical protein
MRGEGKADFLDRKIKERLDGLWQTERFYHVGVNLVMAWLLARRSAVITALCPAGIINVVTYSVT